MLLKLLLLRLPILCQEIETLEPAVQDFLNWVKAEEEVVQNLPDVPKADEVAECQTVAAKVDKISDEELLLRLDKLKNDIVPKEIPEAPNDLNVSEVTNSKHQNTVHRPTSVHSPEKDSKKDQDVVGFPTSVHSVKDDSKEDQDILRQPASASSLEGDLNEDQHVTHLLIMLRKL